VDSSGNAYVTGETESPDFPVTSSGFQTTFPPFNNVSGTHMAAAFLAKLNPAGSQLLYSTYLAATSSSINFGNFDDSFATAIAADNSGNAYLAGYTRSLNFPTTSGVVQPSLDGIACRFLVLASTSVASAGGSMSANVTAPAGCNWTATSNVPAWITITSGSSGSGNGTVNFSVAANSGLTRSGSLTIAGQDVAINQQGTPSCVTSVVASSFQNVSAAGGTVNFPVSAPATCSWSANSPVSWINITSGSPGSGNGTVAISFAPNSGPSRNGNINVGGLLAFTGQNGVCGFSQCSDGFVSKINTNASGTASLVYSTYLGGNNFDVATGVAIDGSGDAYVSGTTLSSNFPVTTGAFQTSPKGGRCGSPGGYTCPSAFVAKLNPTATALLFSTYLGGSANNAATAIATDSSGNAYVTGFTNSADFPVSSGVAQSSLASGSCSVGVHSIMCPDAFAAKFSSAGYVRCERRFNIRHGDGGRDGYLQSAG